MSENKTHLRIDQCFVFQTLWRTEGRISVAHRCVLFSDTGYDLYKYRDIFSDHVDQPMVPETMANDRDDTDSVCDHPCMDMGFQIYAKTAVCAITTRLARQNTIKRLKSSRLFTISLSSVK